MKTTQDTLLLSVDRLERVLSLAVAGRQRDWAEQVGNALSGVEIAVRQHAASTEAPDGMYAQMDLTRPTLARQVSELRQENKDCVQQASRLRDEAAQAGKLVEPPAE